jgi:drug/metabolite transporter (DMT)-like permease
MFLGVGLALVTSVSWAFGNVYIQKSGRAAGAAAAMVWALAAGGLLSALFALLFDQRTAPVDGAVVGWTVTAGVSGAVAYVCLFEAFERARLSHAVPIVSSWSLISALLAITVFGERLRAPQLAGAATVFVGVLLVSLGAARKGRDDHGADRASGRRGMLAAAGAAVGFGIMVPAIGRLVPAFGEFGSSAVVYALGLAFGVPAAAMARLSLRLPAARHWPLLLLTGCFETAGFIAVAFARRFAPMTVITPVASLASALTVLYAWLVLRERPDPLSAIGAALASIGVVIVSL